MSSIMKLM